MTYERTHNAKFDKKHVELLLNLYSKQPWLIYRKEAVMELHSICNSDDEFILICELLQRFTYIKGSTFVEFLNNVSSNIKDHWKLPEKSTIIIATTADQAPDSAQVVIYELRPALLKNGWYHSPGNVFFNSLDKAFKEMRIRAGTDNINIVFVDEFIGTGSTVESRIRSTKNHLEHECGITLYNIKVCVLASMEPGKAFIDSLGVECYSHTVLKKGIAGYLSGTELEEAYNKMLRLESTLASEIGDIKLPSFGYGKVEALYARQGYSEESITNTPNSVFPIFWWPKYLDEAMRKTILNRAF
jgi:hypothetical protein